MKKHLTALLLMSLTLLAAAAPVAASRIPNCFGLEATAGFVGTSGNDIINGTSGDDVIVALGGDDTIHGNGGLDRICGGDGNDRIYGGAGADRIRGDGGDDLLYGGAGCDWLQGGVGKDLLAPQGGGHACAGTAEGGPGRDRFLIDESGDNEVFGGLGVDTLDLRHAPAPMTVGFAPGHYDSEPGYPAVGSLFWDIENVFGSAFDDYLYGDGKNNRLLGFGGDDDLYGRGGDDFLDGGEGFDYLNGGDGSDACREWEIAAVNCES